MKILALGGSGGIGRYAVRSLYNVKEIYIADLIGSYTVIRFGSSPG